MPAHPLVVAAMNPCPCGYAGDKKRACRCTQQQAERYRTRVSGPMVDRFDTHVQLPPVPVQALDQAASGEASSDVRTRVIAARTRALERESAAAAAQNRGKLLLKDVEAPGRNLLVRSIDALGLSLRAYTKILRVSRTIADLAGSDGILREHIAEAIQYRLLDRDVRTAATSGTIKTRIAREPTTQRALGEPTCP